MDEQRFPGVGDTIKFGMTGGFTATGELKGIAEEFMVFEVGENTLFVHPRDIVYMMVATAVAQKNATDA